MVHDLVYILFTSCTFYVWNNIPSCLFVNVNPWTNYEITRSFSPIGAWSFYFPFGLTSSYRTKTLLEWRHSRFKKIHVLLKRSKEVIKVEKLKIYKDMLLIITKFSDLLASCVPWHMYEYTKLIFPLLYMWCMLLYIIWWDFIFWI